MKVCDTPLAQAETALEEFLHSPATSSADAALYVERDDDTVEQRCLYSYFRTGSMAAVSREIGLSLYELKKLAATSWWADELVALRREEAAALNVKFSKVLTTTMGQIEERLDKGNIIIVQGRARYVPLTAGELIRIADVVFDKRQLLRGEATVIAGDNKKLTALAEKLTRLGQSPTQTFEMAQGAVRSAEAPQLGGEDSPFTLVNEEVGE